MCERAAGGGCGSGAGSLLEVNPGVPVRGADEACCG